MDVHLIRMLERAEGSPPLDVDDPTPAGASGGVHIAPGGLDAVARITAAIATARTLAETYDAALDGLQLAFNVDRASILLFDADGVMRFKAWRGLSPEYRAAVEGHTPWAAGQPPPPPVLVPDVREDPSLAPYAEVFAREQITGLAFFPLLSAGGVIGKFMLYRRTGAFSVEHISAARTIGFVLGYAIERTMRLADAQRDRERLLFALDAATMGTWQWNLATQEVRWSDNLERIHGLPPGTFTGGFDSYAREIHPDDRERVFASIQRAIGEDTTHDVEYRIVAPDGTVRWVHGRGRVERDEAGTAIGMAGVCMDISARRGVEEENRRLYARLTTLTSGSYQLLTALDVDSAVREALRLAQAVIPADAYAVWRRHDEAWEVAGHAGLSDAFVSVRLAAAGTAFAFTEPIVASDLSSPLLSGRAAAYAAEGIASLVSIPLAVRGRASGSIVFYYRARHEPSAIELQVAVALGQLAAAAISNAEMYAAQQALRRSAEAAELRAQFLAEASARLSSVDYEANLRAIALFTVSHLCDWCAVDVVNDDGALKRVTVAHVSAEHVALAEDMHRRYPEDLARPQGVGQVLRSGEPELYPEISDDMLAQSAHDAEHLRLLRQVGVTSAMLVPLIAGTRVLGVISFVSSRPDRRFDADDLALASELGRRAGFAIENARLYAEANRANRLKDEFLATLSHELRTPLNVIAGRAHVLAASAETAQVRSAAEAIDRNSVTLARLVDDLLDVSRMTIGQVRLDSQRVDVTAVVTAAVHAVQAAAAAKAVRLQVSVDGDAVVTGDPTRLQQVAWNLLTNAVKFTPAGGSVDVTARVDRSSVVLDVRDSGEGITREALPHVFDRFWQADAPASRRQAGLGLGLAIVKSLVELHGGTVSATSEGPGRGSTFTVVLPRADVPSQP